MRSFFDVWTTPIFNLGLFSKGAIFVLKIQFHAKSGA
jgi:hypothetical protein